MHKTSSLHFFLSTRLVQRTHGTSPRLALNKSTDIAFCADREQVFGPVSGGNGAMDYAGTCKINGGILCAVGSAGMAQGVNSDTQGCIGVQFFAQANTKVDIAEASGNVIFSIISPKNFQTLVMSHPDVAKGATYSITVNGEKLGDITAK